MSARGQNPFRSKVLAGWDPYLIWRTVQRTIYLALSMVDYNTIQIRYNPSFLTILYFFALLCFTLLCYSL